ncbi:SDR family oxidoreductase [Streptomyces sp. AK02-01A]|uniref:SDR family oxidoreductase n=1 Tax=Streptomyces sp. AK02-01A TaxID=3028648 RepID=UPI00299FE6C5|nr:SDR family oxidoreductase [Streptomyces sp. AK02-01A]MDX3850778.1 SDR family oxidoreductase [Streptomyces sp. AK02-01A]
MSTVVTGATGHLGRLVVEALLRRGVRPSEIVATGRDTEKIKDLADLGVVVRRADFADSASLGAAFAGARKLLLVSTTTVGERVANHRRALEAARAAGVSEVVYTSMSNADSATMTLAKEHRATERHLRDSGVPFVILRNGWYLENYTEQLASVLEHRTVAGSAGEGRVSAASRADYAEAAAIVLTTEGHLGSVYELGGDKAFSLTELAAAYSDATGHDITYAGLPATGFAELLTGAGLPREFAEVLADADLGLARGELFTDSGDLSRLLGRPTTSLAEAISSALAARRTAH